ncbi:MAG: hypothetical protein LLG06_19515 [Desulfobacteraceae bacterium]|nr:hypothetical protein [Desulfobacteraceae bacterium]
MELKDLIARDRRASGLSCQNCANLAREYDLDAGGDGTWVCDKLPGKGRNEGFPFQYDMPCFELPFWFSVFAQNLPVCGEAGCDAALEHFTNSLASISGARTIQYDVSGASMDKIS